MNRFQGFICIILVIAQALRSTSLGFLLALPSKNKAGKQAYFNHYYVETLFMAFGNMLNFGAYFFLKNVIYRNAPDALGGQTSPVAPLIMLPATLLDITSFFFSYAGMGLLLDAAFYQMIKTSLLFFCMILSYVFLKKIPKWYQCFGVFLITLGIFIKSSDTPMIPAGCDYSKINTTITTFSPVFITDEISFPLVTETGPNPTGRRKYLGIILTIISQFFRGCVYIYREKFVKKYNLHPLKAAGLEGAYGLVIVSLLLGVMYFIPMPSEGAFSSLSLGPEGRMEDAIDAFKMIFDGGQYWLPSWLAVYTLSVSLSFYSGITITKQLSGTHRAVFAQVSMVMVWVTFLVPLGPDLCRVQDFFIWTAPLGLFILCVGVLIYNDILIMTLVRKVLHSAKKTVKIEDDDERRPLLESKETPVPYVTMSSIQDNMINKVD